VVLHIGNCSRVPKLVFDGDCDTVGALVADSDSSSLNFVMVADFESIQTEYDKICQRVNYERMKPTNVTSSKRLARLLARAQALEEATLQKGISLARSYCDETVRERPSLLASRRIKRKKAQDVNDSLAAMIAPCWFF